jgi:diacylglycerol kinase (ATP)
MKPHKFSLKSRLGSFRFALNGLSSLLKNEHNSRIHLIAATVAIIMGILLKLSIYEWPLLVIVIGIVFIAELLNSSIESLANLLDPEWNEMIMRAKDFGAGAVLISAIVAVIAGGLIFIPKLLDLF